MKAPQTKHLILVTVLLFFVARSTEGMGLGNFKFGAKNVIYGDTPTQRIRIQGDYFFYLFEQMNLTSRTDLKPIYDYWFSRIPVYGPWVCVGMTDKIVGTVGPRQERRATENLRRFVEWKSSNGLNIFDQSSAFVDVSEPDYICNRLSLTFSRAPVNPRTNGGPVEEWYGHFDFFHDFDKYQPLIFVDSFGMGAFHFRKKIKTEDMRTEQGDPLRYCSGSGYTGEMYTIEPRPTCPSPAADSNKLIDAGYMTVYKINIASLTREAHKCSYTNTYLYSSTNGWGSTTRNNPVAKPIAPPTEAECWEMVKNKKSKHGDLKAGFLGFGGYGTYNDKRISSGWFKSSSRNVKDAYYTTSIMVVGFPSLQISTPWWKIPTSRLYDSSHSNGVRGILVWEAFQVIDICMHVPFFTSSVRAVTYLQGSNLVKRDPHPDAVNLTYFISHSAKAIFQVDNTQLLTGPDVDFNCITAEFNDSLYMTNDGNIIKYAYEKPSSDGDSLSEFYIEHPSASYGQLGVGGDGNINSITTDHETIDDTVADMIPLISPTIDVAVSLPPPENVQNFQDYVDRETSNRNVARQISDSCAKAQVNWDSYTLLLDIDPTKAISKRIRKGIEATHAGNGMYNIRQCDIISNNFLVVGQLNTNSSVNYTINGEQMSVRQMVRLMRVIPHNDKCMVMPLIIFSPTSQTGNQKFFGQLSQSGIIKTDRLDMMEQCQQTVNHVFNIGKEDYFFIDYTLNYKVPHSRVISQVLRNAETRDILSGSSVNKQNDILRDIINNIKIIPISTVLDNEYFEHYPVGLLSTNLYTQSELQSLTIGVSNVVAALSYNRWAAEQFQKTEVIDYTGESISLDGFGEIISGLGAGIGDAFRGLGDGIGSAAEGIGGGVGNIAEGVGKGGATLLDSVTSGFGGILLQIIVPIVVVVGLAGLGFVLYKKYQDGDFEKAGDKFDVSYNNDGGQYGQLPNEEQMSPMSEGEDEDDTQFAQKRGRFRGGGGGYADTTFDLGSYTYAPSSQQRQH